MRVLVLGDIHGNLEALRAVLDHARAQGGFDHVVSVGDVVGYGADPGPCLGLLRELDAGIVMGNHDLAVVGGLPTDGFNVYAKAAVEWTAAKLTTEELGFLRALPATLKHPEYAVSHGTLHDPEGFRYLLTEADAVDSLAILDRPVCFLGHTHLPVWARMAGASLEVSQIPTAPVDPGRPVVVNVGSVGQPRDGDPRTIYALYDTEIAKVEMRRLAYDVEGAGRKILAAGLPDILAERLKVGR